MDIKTIFTRVQRISTYRKARAVLLLAALLSVGAVGSAAADQSSSPHYSVSETEFSAGSALQDCSGSYCAKESAGDTTNGYGKSGNYSAEFGFNTSDIPVLEVIAVNNTEDMGVLGTDKTGVAEASLSVRSYLSNGYVIQITGTPPSQGSHQLDTPTSPVLSAQGTEQFGINLAANTTPSVGADPVQVPSSAFSYGSVASNYRQSNKFMYQDGDIVAQSGSSTGQTNYAVSFIANITNVTPAGRYNGNFSAVVVPVY